MFKIFLVCFFATVLSVDVRVNTSLGQIEGKSVFISELNKNVSIFLGIPYAKPPIGDLRFKKSEPIGPWSGIWNATYPRSSCMQKDRNDVDENCLFLNIYVPNGIDKPSFKKSVMFWIYGGAFITGSIFSQQFNATYLSAIGDVVVVEVNYRLSAFGFLYDGSKDAPGNQALVDIINALKFVQNNIDSFAGDPHSVTIFGESAGSMSVSALILTKSTLFQRAIMQSGSVDSYLGSEPKGSALSKAKAMTQHFNCWDESTQQINANCIRKVSPQSIVQYCYEQEQKGAQFFAPIYGDSVLPIKPSTALKTNQYSQNISLLFGTCRDEGAGFVTGFGIKDLASDSPDNSINVGKAKVFIQLLFSTLNISFAKEAADFYTKSLTDNDGYLLKHAVADAFGDYQLTCPTIKFGSELAKSANTYAYRLMFTTRKGWTGVEHSDDVNFVFGAPLMRPNDYNELEKQLSLDFIHIWTTFAKTGKPPAMNGTEWPEAIDRTSVNPSVRYMSLDPSKYEMSSNVYKQSCDGFWKSHLDSFNRPSMFPFRLMSPLFKRFNH